MAYLVVGLILFLGVHSVAIVSPAGRERLAARLGANAYRGVYSLVALAGLVLIVYGYGLARQSPVFVYVTPYPLRYVAAGLLLPVFVLLAAAYLPGRIQHTLKHPMLVAVKLWAVAHLLVNGTLADVLLFGGLMAWAVADRISLKRRAPRTVPGAPAGYYNDWIAVLIGLVVYAVFVFGGHRWLVGVPVLAFA